MTSNIAEDRTQEETKRICSECQTTTSYDNWRLDGKGGWWCKSCYMKFYYRERPSYFWYKDKILWDKQQRRLRKGVCVFCGAKKGDIHPNSGKVILTVRAHIEYHDDDPLKDTIELCQSCHRKFDHSRASTKE